MLINGAVRVDLEMVTFDPQEERSHRQIAGRRGLDACHQVGPALTVMIKKYTFQ